MDFDTDIRPAQIINAAGQDEMPHIGPRTRAEMGDNAHQYEAVTPPVPAAPFNAAPQVPAKPEPRSGDQASELVPAASAPYIDYFREDPYAWGVTWATILGMAIAAVVVVNTPGFVAWVIKMVMERGS